MILRHAIKLGLWSLVLIAVLGSAEIARAQAPGPITKEEFSRAQLQPQVSPGPGVDAGQVRNQLMEISTIPAVGSRSTPAGSPFDE
jgi:hypothetical protein